MTPLAAPLMPLFTRPGSAQAAQLFLSAVSAISLRTLSPLSRVWDKPEAIASNPSIFEKAVAEGAEYDEEIAQAATAGRSPARLYEELISADVRGACDILRRVYDETAGVDGFVSLEVSRTCWRRLTQIIGGSEVGRALANGFAGSP
jgi:transaldolase